MDTKRLKRCKHPKKMKTNTDDGDAEVFVLPPDLLKKLGIRLGNASDTHGSATDVTVAGAQIENKLNSTSNISKSTDDASMLETANLMKKSVFLSPTFVSTVANVFPGEMEIANIVEKTDTPIMVTEAVNSKIFPVDNIEINNMSVSETATATETSLINNPTANAVFITVENNDHYNSTQINDPAFENNKNISDSSLNTMANIINPIANILNNHVDEEHCMNYGNNNSKPTQQSNQVTCPQYQKMVSKINIISEEIIGPSKLKGLKRLPNITALTPVTIDTKIGTNMTDTVHTPIQISPKSKESKLYISEDLIINQNIPNGDLTKKMLNEIAVTHDCDYSTQLIYNVVNTKVPHNKSIDCDSNNTVNAKETCNSDVFAYHVGKNIEKNEDDFGKLSSEVAKFMHSSENKDCTDLNITGNKSLQNEILYADDIVGKDVDSKTLNVIKNTVDVKEDATVVKVFSQNDSVVNKDCNNVHDVQIYIKANNENSCQESNNGNSDNLGAHDFDVNVEKQLEHHEDIVGKSTGQVLYSNENEVLMVVVDDNSKIQKEEKVILDKLKPDDGRYTSPDTLSDKMVTLVAQDSKDYTINNQEIPEETGGNNLICYLVQDDEMNLENNEKKFSNRTGLSNVNDDNTHNVAKGCIISTLHNTIESGTFDAREVSVEMVSIEDCNIDVMNNTSNDVNSHRNIDLEIHGIKNYVENTKELECGKVLTKTINHDYTNIRDSEHHLMHVSRQTIENYDLNKSRPLVYSNGVVQQDNQKNNIIDINKDSANANTNTDMEKVKQIAEYLKTITHIRSGKNKLENREITTNNNKHESIELNPNKIKSKSSIQGVEKPGGIKIESRKRNVLKTYQRHNRLKDTCFSTTNKCHIAEYMETDVNSDIINTLDISTNVKTQEFCLCNDFGRLDYYDGDDLYEHLHFCQHRDTNCDLDLILNIYNDDALSEQKEIHNDYNITEDDNETAEFNICWNVFQNRNEEYGIEKKLFDGITEQKHELIVDKEDDFTTPNVDLSSATNIILSEKHNIVSTFNENGCISDLVNPVKESTNIATNSDYQSPDLIITMKGDANSTSNGDIQESSSDKNIQNSDLLSLEDLNIVSNMDNVPQTTIININSAMSTDNVDHAKHSFGDVIDHESLRTEIIIKDEDIGIDADKTINENHLDFTMNNDLTDDDEDENLLLISNKKAISNLKENETTQSEVSNENVKIRRKRRKDTDDLCAKKTKTPRRDYGILKIECAVCHELFSEKKWETHVIGEHQFIAWRDGDTFNLDDADLHKKLKQSLKLVGYLKCTFCNLEMSTLKKFLQHIRICMKIRDNNTAQVTDDTATSTQANVICGVCKTEVQYSSWFEHIGKYHKYLAWIDGLDPVKVDDKDAVREHLMTTMKHAREFCCYKCGICYKSVKKYLSHVESCDGDESNIPTTSCEEKQSVICGVCKQAVQSVCWVEHIAKEHNYLAWQENEPPLILDDEKAVWEHLQQFIRFHGGLTCHKCGLKRKRVKLYLNHIKTCDGTAINCNISTVSNDLNTTNELDQEVKENPTPKEFVKCGVCDQLIPGLEWMEHVVQQHDYMAWEHGSQVDVNDKNAVQLHLHKIVKQLGELVCKKCGVSRKYVKLYLDHLKECPNDTLDGSKWIDEYITTATVVCGVCKVEVKKDDWIEHITSEHRYLAWIDGQTPIDVQNDKDVYRHLFSICKLVNGFKCARCDTVRVYVKAYMQHIKECKMINKETVLSAIRNNELLECAICHKNIDPKKWREHAMEEHYNIAWVVGEPDVDLNNPYAVAGFLKDYLQKYHKFVCKVCGINRASAIGFYAHILTCGKSAEEMEPYKEECEICNSKYLRVYKTQHMRAHREFELAKERRVLAAAKAKKKIESEEPISGRRRAAERAKTVLEKYKSNVNEGSHSCPTCRFKTDIESELSEHVCAEEDEGRDFSESDESVNMEQWSDDESVDTDVDSNLSDEELASEELVPKKKRHGEPSAAAKVQRIPFSVENPRSYLKQCGKEFIEMYWSKADLFTEWRRCEYELVNEEDKANYLPPIEESCKIRFSENSEVSTKQMWNTYNRFEARKSKICTSIFVGASIRCIAWAPSPLAREVSASEGQFLAVACHLAGDEPRHAWADTVAGPALIQIWDCGDMRGVPQFALGIALDYGTVWAIDWCPSGARDAPDQQDSTIRRLGLLAAACSNGFAYIFSVPYPSTITETDKLFYKLKPVAQLRLAMSADRKIYQATSLKWSQQKGHSHILVGYSDGTIAYYDLNTESPILKTTENNITIFYPYYDEKFLNGSIEGVDLYPVSGGSGDVCAGASAAGGRLGRAGPGAGAGGIHLAAAQALFLPHWPSAMLVGDDMLLGTSVGEMCWWGLGRRFGGARAAAGCVRCGRAALASQRQLRLLAAHPIHADLHKMVVGVLDMVPCNDKRKRKKNDDLSMVVEPTSYEDAVQKYGLQYQAVSKKDKGSQPVVRQQAYPERFPLAEMTSLAFCTSEQHHDKLAVAVHAGFVLIVTL